MSQKRILFLGASAQQIPPIQYALEQGHYVITCDYLPENPGHKLAHEWHNVSTTDKEAVLELSQKLKIDGIVAYASDPAAPTQAYVAEKMGLVGNPYESVLILARKDLFRAFLAKHDFLVPKSSSFYKLEPALEWLKEIGLPAIVKPVDSSGSKGVTKITEIEHFKEAFEYALQFSREKLIVVEEFFVRDGYQVDGDGFMVDGSLIIAEGGNQHNDHSCNSFVPTGISFPSIVNDSKKELAKNTIEHCLQLMGFKNGAINFEYQFDVDGKFFLIEIGPRNGGNLIPEVIKYSTGIDLIKYTVDSALGLDCSDLTMKPAKGFYSSYMLHALEDGKVKEIWYSDEIKKNIIQETIYIKSGDEVHKFNGAHHALGSMIMKFETQEEMLHKMDNMEHYLYIITE